MKFLISIHKLTTYLSLFGLMFLPELNLIGKPSVESQMDVILAASIPPTQKADSLLQILSQNYRDLAPQIALKYAEEVRKISHDQNPPHIKGKVGALNIKGIISYWKLQDYYEALQIFNQCLDLLEKSGYEKELIRIHNNMGIVYGRLDWFEGAINSYRKSLSYLGRIEGEKESWRLRELSNVCSNMGIYFMESEKLDSAKVYLFKSLKYRKTVNSPWLLANIYNKLGSFYRMDNQLDSAYQFLDSTYHLFQIKKFIKPSDSLLCADALMIEGTLLEKQELYELAINRHQQALAIYTTNKDSFQIAKTHINLGNNYERLNKYEAALQAYRTALTFTPNPDYRLYKTLYYSKSAFYSKIKSLEKRSQQKALQYKISIGGLVGLLLLLIFGLRYYYKSQKATQLALVQSKEIHQQTTIDLLKDRELEITSAIIEGQDTERKRIAAELHDGTAGTLAAARNMLEAINHTENQAHIQDLLSRGMQLVAQAYNDIRNLSHQLIEINNRNTFGDLQAGFQDVTQNLRLLNIAVDIQATGDIEIPLSHICMFHLRRIIRELTTNIIKHANAQQVTIRTMLDEIEMTVLIEDDGCGFDPKLFPEGLGMKSIDNRVKILKGSWEIDSFPGKGTRVVITVPYSEVRPKRLG